MLTLRSRDQSCGVKGTKVERDLGRILPPEREDLRGLDPRVYRVSIMGEHTVAGVEVAILYDGTEMIAVADQAEAVARRAKVVAAEARQIAEEAAVLAVQARDVANKTGGTRGALEADLGNSVVDPHATARELIKVREALLSRIG